MTAGGLDVLGVEGSSEPAGTENPRPVVATPPRPSRLPTTRLRSRSAV